MVHYRRIRRHDRRLCRHGIRKHHLGKPVRPVRTAPDSDYRVLCLGRRSGTAEPGDIAHPVSADLRVGGWRCDRGHLCAHDGLRDRLVRHSSEPSCVSRVSAGMGMAPMTMSPLAARLISNHDWRTSLQILAALAAVVMIPVAFARASPAGVGIRQCRPYLTRRAAARDDRRAGS
jgi:hypothetical protein